MTDVLKQLILGMFLFSSLSFAAIRETAEFMILESEEEPEHALVIFPGAFVAPSAYESLGLNLQEKLSRPTRIYIAKFFGRFANSRQAKQRIEQVRQELQELGYERPEKRIFLLGHSQGGVTAGEIAGDLSLGGLILTASYLPESASQSRDVRNYPIPVLTLGGDLDGLTGINFLAREFRKTSALDRNEQLKKPVIILDGVNHMQFADGGPLQGDLEAEVPLMDAHEMIAQVIHDYLTFLHSNDDRAKIELQDYLKATQVKINGLLSAWTDKQNSCLEAQRGIAGLTSDDWSLLSVTEKIYTNRRDYLSFIFDKSSLQRQEDTFELYIPSFLESSFVLGDSSAGSYLSPAVHGCKMRSQESVLSVTGMKASRQGQTCAEVNFSALQKAYGLLTESQRERLAKKLGIQNLAKKELGFNAENKSYVLESDGFQIIDYTKERGEQWAIGAFPRLFLKDQTWTLETYSVKTALDAPADFGGAFYCKVIPTARFVEWFLLFSLKSAGV